MIVLAVLWRPWELITLQCEILGILIFQSVASDNSQSFLWSRIFAYHSFYQLAYCLLFAFEVLVLALKSAVLPHLLLKLFAQSLVEVIIPF